ncbi:MAG: penicillin-binding transpeptidase domain-containing protein [Gemmatimonadales bacterium]
MAKPAVRIAALQFFFAAGLMAVLARAAWIQLVRGDELGRRAEAIRTAPRELDARRGTIYDRKGIPLVVSQAKFRVQLALNEVRDTAQVLRRLSRDLGIRADSLRRIFRRGKPHYPYFHGPFTASQVAGLRSLRGVHLEATYSRSYPNGSLAGPIIGRLGDDGRGASGLERSLDSLLAGIPGLTTDLRDPSGRRFESPGRLIREPVAGHDVVLTLDAELQAIAEYTLARAVREYRAEGGDVVFFDPRSGELLALASRSAGGAGSGPSFLTSPFEPGSTAKPFTAAALLALERVGPDETVSGENGVWKYVTTGRATRAIRDVHPDSGEFTLARAIRQSSNIAMAKFALKLRPEEHYETLRRFGFGAPTGTEFPSEAVGHLTRPHRWRYGYDAQSVAMGYSFSVTPVQLAAAYGALANDGILLAPTLVREIRGPDGETAYRHEPEVVRRVVPAKVAATIREFLGEAASDSGTGGRAQVRGGLLGKTGTALVSEQGRYEAGNYRASFAAIYPAKDPQLIAVVTIDRPRGAYYGGQTAAPVTADMLRQALAAKDGGLDLGEEAVPAVGRSGGRAVGNQEPPSDNRESVATLPIDDRPTAQPPARPTIVPDVAGRTVREAVFALHQRGFRVRVEGTGRAVRTSPSAGDSLPVGRTVVLYAANRLP